VQGEVDNFREASNSKLALKALDDEASERSSNSRLLQNTWTAKRHEIRDR